jgi:hypothetical protein
MKELREAGRKNHERRVKSFGGKKANRDFGGMQDDSPMGAAADGTTASPIIDPGQMGNPPHNGRHEERRVCSRLARLARFSDGTPSPRGASAARHQHPVLPSQSAGTLATKPV